MRGVSIPPLFLCVSLLLTEVHARHLFGLTVFPLYHIFPQVLKDSSTDVSLSPALVLGYTAFWALPAQDRLMIPQD